MRKRRRLADKLTISVCAVLVAVSAFFYAPMDVSAEEFTGNGEAYGSTQSYNNSIQEDFGLVDLYPEAQDGVVYKVDMHIRYQMYFGNPMYWRNIAVRYGNIPLISVNDPDSGTSTNALHYVDRTVTVYLDSTQINGKSFNTSSRHIAQTDFGVFTFYSRFTYEITSIVSLSATESEQYQLGYQNGYSEGFDNGENSGYSSGFQAGVDSVDTDSVYQEGFQAGIDSVDTDGLYQAGYNSGVQVGYQEGYRVGYDDGYADAMEYAMSLYGVDSEDFKDLGKIEKYGSGSYSGTWYLSDFYITSHVDPNPYISSTNKLYVYPTDRKGIVNFSQSQTLALDFEKMTGSAMVENLSSDLIKIDFDLAHSFDFDESVIGDTYSSDGGLNASFTLNSLEVIAFGESYTVSKFNHPSVIIKKPYPQAVLSNDNFALKIGYSVTCWMTSYENPETSTHVDSSVLGHVYPSIKLTIGSSDSTFSVTQFKSISDSDSHGIMNGFDSSQGNSVNGDLSSGLNEYQTSEDTLWATATTGLKDFTFFDFASVPAMITGMSFITAIMGSWFNQAGGASGVGIVLSILFSVVLVAMVLGLYRWYQSRGGKD